MAAAGGMRFRRGLIVGKFSPLHRGHVLLIERALEACDELVLLSYAKPDYPGCGTAIRRRWLEALFPQARLLVVDDDWLAERRRQGLADPFAAVPDDSEPEDLHRRFTAWLAQGVLGLTCDAVFTSEDYGAGFAVVLAQEFGHEVTHVCVDRARRTIPVSATAIRQDLHLRRDFLPPVVADDLPTRLVVLGAESTGKSTLCAAMGARWREPVADEFGRELWLAKDGRLVLSDMLDIARVQVAREDQLLADVRHTLICDTSPLTTAFFSRAMFGKIVPELERLALRPYDLTFLCMPDFPFMQDGTRQDEDFRKALHETYVAHLTSHGIPFVSLSGGIDDRLETIENNLGLARQCH